MPNISQDQPAAATFSRTFQEFTFATASSDRPDDCLILSDGKFDGMTSDDLHAYMQRYAALAAQRPLVVHFHGGLDTKADGLDIAARLRQPYSDAGGFPLFFVWESGLFEIIKQSLPQMLGESVSKQLFGILLGAVAKKVGVPMPVVAAAAPDEDVGIAALMAPASTIEDALRAADALAPITHDERAALVDEINHDPTVIELVVNVSGETSIATADISPDEARLLPRSSSFTLMKPEVVAELRRPAGIVEAGLPVFGIAVRAGKLLVRIVERFIGKRDHGLYVTIAEEILNEFYIGGAAREVWREMKNATEHAFGSDAACGGTAFVNELCALVAAGRTPPKVVLIGHSTGAVYICNLLKHADAALRRVESAGHPAFQFDIVFLAPACTVTLFDDTLREVEHRVRDFRTFGMSDEIEQADKIVGDVYPRSLLYFVSGVCETDASHDAPILGMQRYQLAPSPFDAGRFPDIARVREYLSTSGRTAWSATGDQAPTGQRSGSQHHGDFASDPQTIDSLRAFIASTPPVATADTPLVVFPARIAGLSRREAAKKYTGRYLVMFHDGATEHGQRLLQNKAGVASAAFVPKREQPEMRSGSSVAFPRFDVAVMAMDPDQRKAAGIHAASAGSPIQLMVPERIVYAASLATAVTAPIMRKSPEPSVGDAQTLSISRDYLTGLGDGGQAVIDMLLKRRSELGKGSAATPPTRTAQWVGDTTSTWAIQAIAANQSKYSGKGISIAVLDTGFFSAHPHFAVRNPVMKSFLADSDADAQDRNGHGTHCIGLACGPREPAADVPRYGVAYDADIYVGKVLSDAGTGADMNITAGIDWAVENHCTIVSMSFAAAVGPSDQYNAFYERIASRALAAGTLIVAAAGNDSRRPIYLAPISHPANCVSIKAVGAIDEDDAVGFFSNSGINPNDGGVAVVAPGVRVLSSWCSAPLIKEESGTSMATPLVAGVAALWAEKTNLRGDALWKTIVANVLTLDAPGSDVGAGLVQAPVE